MNKIKKGDIVSRYSHQNDILFYVERIIKSENRGKCVIIKGITFRIEADAPFDDLKVENEKKIISKDLFSYKEQIYNKKNRSILQTGKILHIDGDKNYSEKTDRYYKSKGLNYVVKHVPEYKQPSMINLLLNKYNPSILIITGHDGMIRTGKNYNDINNYRNSRYFIRSVYEARLWNPNSEQFAIFAGACQSFYEAIIAAGANFASSPGRILIDFMDPLIVAENIATTDNSRIVVMSDLENKIRNGRKAIDGIGVRGKRFVIFL